MSRIDPSISLRVNPPEKTADPIENYSKFIGIRDALQRGRMNELSLKAGEAALKTNVLKNQEEERNQAADKAVRDAIQANTNMGEDGSFSINHDAVEAMITRAGYPDRALAYNKIKMEAENASYEHAEKEMTIQAKRAKMLGNMAQTILNAPEELRPDVYGFTLKQAVAQKLVEPQTLQKMGIDGQWDPQKTPAMLQQLADLAQENPYEAYVKRMQEKRAEAEEKRKVAEADATLPGKKADTLEKQVKAESQVLGGAKTPEDWSAALAQLPEDRRKLYPAEYSDEARQRAAAMGISPDTRAQLARFTSPTELAYAAQRGDKDAKAALKDLESREIRIDTAKKMAEYNALFGGSGAQAAGPAGAVPSAALSKSNDAALNNLTPAVAAQVKALAEGRMAFPSGFALKSPYWQAMISKVAEYDPSFDATNYNNRAKLRADFTTGKSAQTINALNTVAQHLGRIEKSIDGLGNWDGIPLFNKTANEFKNWFKTQSGNTKEINRFQDDVEAVASEAVRAWRQAGGTEADIQAWKKNLSASDSPSGLRESLSEIADLLEGKLLAQQNQLDQGMGPFAGIKVVSPQAQAMLDKLRGIKTEEAKYGDPRITEDIMQRARAANPGVDDATLAAAIKAKLDGKNAK